MKTKKALILLDTEDNYKRVLLIFNSLKTKKTQDAIKKAINDSLGQYRKDFKANNDKENLEDYDNMISLVQQGKFVEFMDYEIYVETVPYSEEDKKKTIYLLNISGQIEVRGEQKDIAILNTGVQPFASRLEALNTLDEERHHIIENIAVMFPPVVRGEMKVEDLIKKNTLDEFVFDDGEGTICHLYITTMKV